MSEMFKALFTCHGTCGLQGVTIEVPCRADNEDVVDFVKRLQQAASDKHNLLVPHCECPKFSMAIPFNEESDLGTKLVKTDGKVPESMKSKGAN